MAKKKNDNATGAGLYIGCLLMMTIGIVFITLFSIAIQLIPLAVPIIIFLIFVGALFLYVGEDGQNVKRKFKLTDNEQVEFDKLGHLLNQAYRKINECKNIIETEHLHINQMVGLVKGAIGDLKFKGLWIMQIQLSMKIAIIIKDLDFSLLLSGKLQENTMQNYLAECLLQFIGVLWYLVIRLIQYMNLNSMPTVLEVRHLQVRQWSVIYGKGHLKINHIKRIRRTSIYSLKKQN